MPKTPAQRKAEERARHKAAGRVAITVYVRPSDKAKVRDLAAELNNQQQANA